MLNKTPELAQALKVAYPDFEWDNSRFTSTSLHQPDTQRKLLGRIGEQLGIKEVSGMEHTLWLRSTDSKIHSLPIGMPSPVSRWLHAKEEARYCATIHP